MRREEMYELAKIGLREKLRVLENDLKDKYKEFPDLFLGPPQFLRPDLRSSSNGHGPVMITSLPMRGLKIHPMLAWLQAHGPTRLVVVAKALKLKSVSSLASTVTRHVKAGTLERVSSGTYGITAAGIAAIASTPTRKPSTAKRHAQRQQSADLLDAVQQAGRMTTAQIKSAGHHAGGLGSLVRRGYLKRSGKGKHGVFTRTAKAFDVETTHP